MWHPKFYLAFSKLFLVLREVIWTFLLKELSLSKYFLLWLVLHFWIHSKLDFGSWRFSSFIWTKTKMFFSWKKCPLKISLKGPIAFGMIFFHFQKFLLPWPKGKFPPISLSSSLDHDMLQIQQVEPLHIIISIYFLSKTISAFYLDPWRFTKELPFLLWVLLPNQFP